MPLMSVPWRLRQVNLCKIEVSLVYREISRTDRFINTEKLYLENHIRIGGRSFIQPKL